MNMQYFRTAIGLVTMVLIYTSCAPAIVVSEPTYVDVVRPKQPSAVHVWVGNGWAYNRSSHSYVQRNGYWAVPRRGRVYHQGYWRKSRRGSVWVNGHW